MSQAVKISDVTMDALRAAAHLHSRSVNGQAEHWMRIGRAVERDPAFAYGRIELALRGLEPIDPDTLSEQEQDNFILAVATAPSTAQEEDFWRTRRERGLGVGLDDDDQLLYGEHAAKSRGA